MRADSARRPELSSKKLALAAARQALSRKAEEVVLLDLRNLSPIADFFVICSGVGEAQVKAICDAVERGLRENPDKHKPWHVEGYNTLRWVLLDYVNVVVHVFQEATREYYSLDKFWGDAPREEIKDESQPAGGQTP